MTNLHHPSTRFLIPQLALITLLASCTQTQASKTELTMQVQPAGQSGVYTVSGRTNLPEQTRITIQAVRDLRLAPPSSEGSQPSSKLTNDRPVYSILGRAQVNVKDGQWQTNVNLLHPTSNGQALEAWQTNDAQLGLKPETKVVFLAVTDPISQALDVQQASGSAQSDNVSIRFTADGKSYVQAGQSLMIDPPDVKVANRPLAAPVVNVSVKSATGELKKQTDAPLSPNAIAR